MAITAIRLRNGRHNVTQLRGIKRIPTASQCIQLALVPILLIILVASGHIEKTERHIKEPGPFDSIEDVNSMLANARRTLRGQDHGRLLPAHARLSHGIQRPGLN